MNAWQVLNNVNPMLALFLTTEGIVHKEERSIRRPWIAMLWRGWKYQRWSNFQSNGAIIPGPCTHANEPAHTPFLVWHRFWFQRKKDSHFQVSLFTRPRFLCSFLISEIKIQVAMLWENSSVPGESQGVMMSTQNDFNIASNNGTAAQIALLTRKWTTSKQTDTNTISDEWLSLSRQISGTFW
jgi:hypothetical protein